MNREIPPLIMFVVALVGAPFLFGVINRVKAKFAGRRGPPLLQLYYDLRKLAAKDVVYSRTATWVFRFCPVAALGGSLAAALVTPFGCRAALVSFPGDFLIWAGAFTLARIFMTLAALDTGSAFEGMGASRELWYGALAEPALFLAMAVLAALAHDLSLTGFFLALTPETTARQFMAVLFAALALLLVALAENARIPVDDPATHLELTMIHEVMILDHSGPDLAMLEYAAALKLWVMGSLVVGLAVPVYIGEAWQDALCFLAGMLAFAAIIGCVESLMARLRLIRVPQMLVGASVLALLALIIVARNK